MSAGGEGKEDDGKEERGRKMMSAEGERKG